MRSLQDYKDIFRNIATDLNLQGDSVEVLVQMLANASYISEVENLSYLQEASLERATLLNSKIQHCVNNMYSVFRGKCPRIILNLRPNKYFSLKVYDEIATSNNFKIYYLGYLPKNSDDSEFIYAPCTIKPAVEPDDTYTIVGLLATNKFSREWTTKENQFYVETTKDNLSNDMYVSINNIPTEVTREFSRHILDNKIFDLTLPSFGSRLYFPNAPVSSGNIVNATYFYYTTLNSLSESELKKIMIRGAELMDFDLSWLDNNGYAELSTGIIVLGDESKDNIDSIHYKASKDRYVNAIIRSNSDIGVLLQEMYPNKVKQTSYEFKSNEGNNILTIYYVPGPEKLTNGDKQEFFDTREAYFIANTVNIAQGIEYVVNVSLVAELYTNESPEKEIQEILSNYSGKFNIDLDNRLNEISSLISKLSNIKSINSIDLSYKDSTGQVSADVTDIYNNLNKSYFRLNLSFTPIIKQITT